MLRARAFLCLVALSACACTRQLEGDEGVDQAGASSAGQSAATDIAAQASAGSGAGAGSNASPAGSGTGGASGEVEAAGASAHSGAGTQGSALDAGSSIADAGLDAALEPEPPPPDLEHRFPELVIPAGAEQTGVCQSWTLGNDEPIHVNRVVAHNEGSLHHSNWIWVDEASYPGPDGTWPCSERGFDQIIAGAFGGVFFAQSTQSLTDTQAFPDGVAFEMPARVRIIGDVHLLNPLASEAKTTFSFEIYTLPSNEVDVKLQPLAYTNTALEVAAAGKTTARMQCATPQPDLDIYYVLPHFHVNGLELRVDVAGGPMDGMNVFTSAGNFGEPLSQGFDPPIPVRGAAGLAITCDYQNPSDSILRYGFGDQEMCVVLIYATGAKAGGMAISNFSVMDTGGTHYTDALCVAVGAP